MRYLVPPFILDRLQSGTLHGTFPAAALFLDMSGFTHMTDSLMQHGQLGAEALTVVMRAVFDPLIARVEQNGGFIARFEGDAFHAVFPAAPDGLSEVAGCALAAAWAMQDWLQTHPTHDTPFGQFNLAAKVGLDIGTLEWGVIQSDDGRRALYYFRGPVIEGSAAAQSFAARGDVLITAAVRMAAAGLVNCEPVPDDPAVSRVTSFGGAPPAPLLPEPVAADPALVARFVPPEVLTLAVSGEFRHVVSLFIHLARPPTDTELEHFMATVFALLDRYGGALAGMGFGDKGPNLLLFWGAPTSTENDVTRAAGFALDLRAQSQLPFSAAFTYRIAHAGFIGGARREDYTCYSRGVNLAARLMMAAPPGAIWLDGPAEQRSRAAFALTYAGARAFKGFQEPVDVFVLEGRSEPVGPAFAGRLVGRASELARLRTFTEPLHSGRSPGMLVVWGEAGMGKSRLMQAFVAEGGGPHISDWRVAYCQTDQIIRGSLNPFRYWLRQYFSQSQARPAGENHRAFARRFAALRHAVASLGAHGARLAAELVRTRAFLAALVDLHAPDALYESLDARSRFENTLLALTALLQAESLRQPVILHIEDAHWLDEDSAQYLAELVRLLASEEGGAFPIALIATARPAAEPLLLDSARPFEELYLSAFGASDLAGLAAETLGAPASQELLDFVAPRAEGNPLFAGQILQYLQEQAALEQDVAGWRLRPGAAAEAFVPGDIQALLVARLDRLTAAVRSVVQTAAVLGREFEVRVLSAMLRDDPQLPEQLDVAERAAIWSALDALRYLFTHALVRDAAYEMQVQSHRVELHHLAASGIETVYSADLPPHYADLAYHFGQAGDATAERRYARLAGERAAGQFANAEAARFLSRALALTPAADSSERYNLLAALERVHDLQGLREEQGKDLAALAAEAGALGDPERQAEATLRLANLARITGDYATALAHVDAIRAGAMAGVEARAALQRAQVLLHLGESSESRRWLRRALRTAESSGARALVAQALYQIGVSYYYQERFAEALEHFQKAQPIYREIADRRGEINSMLMFGTVQSRQGSHMAARAMLNEALDLCRATGWRHGETFILGNLANSYFDLGDYDTTRQLHEAALALSREVGDREGEAASLSTLALVAHRLGDPVWALALYRQAWQIQRAIGDRRGEGYTLTGMGHALADADDLEQAATVFSAALVLRRELEPDSPLAVDDVVGLADVALRRGDFHTAGRYAVEAASWLETHDATGIESPILAWLICYRALVATAGEDAAATARASTCLARGHALLQQQAESIHDEALRQHFLVSVPSNRELLSLWEKATPA